MHVNISISAQQSTETSHKTMLQDEKE